MTAATGGAEPAAPGHAARVPDVDALIEPDPVGIAWLNQGASTEDPWTLAHLRARDAVERRFGERVRTAFVEKVALGTGTLDLIDTLVERGFTMVIAASAPFESFMLEAAERYPRIAFEQARGSHILPNLATFTGAHEQSAFLVGMAAGSLTASGTLAYVLPVREPETIRILNGFTLGARALRPDLNVVVAATGTWWDPERERAVGAQLVEAGADVLATGCTSPGTAMLAAELAIPWCGQDADRLAHFGDVWVSAPCASWSSYACRRVGEFLEGRWASEEHYGSIADGFCDIAPLGHRVESDTRRRVMEARSRLVDGSIEVFAGPVRDVEGRVRVREGEVPSVSDLLTMDWLVEGVREHAVASSPGRCDR